MCTLCQSGMAQGVSPAGVKRERMKIEPRNPNNAEQQGF